MILLYVFIFYGSLGCFIEGLYNSVFTKPHNEKVGRVMKSPKGQFIFTSAYMFIIYGLGGLVSYLICMKSHLWYYFPVFVMIIWVNLVLIEFIGGLVLNKWLKLNIWSYDSEKYNLYGIVSLKSVLLMLVMAIFLYLNNLMSGVVV